MHCFWIKITNIAKTIINLIEIPYWVWRDCYAHQRWGNWGTDQMIWCSKAKTQPLQPLSWRARRRKRNGQIWFTVTKKTSGAALPRFTSKTELRPEILWSQCDILHRDGNVYLAKTRSGPAKCSCQTCFKRSWFIQARAGAQCSQPVLPRPCGDLSSRAGRSNCSGAGSSAQGRGASASTKVHSIEGQGIEMETCPEIKFPGSGLWAVEIVCLHLFR